MGSEMCIRDSLDAPYHFHSTMDRGKKAITIDQVPLEWCFNPGVKFDFRHMEDGYVVTPNDIKAELKRINYEIKPFDIVLVNTQLANTTVLTTISLRAVV